MKKSILSVALTATVSTSAFANNVATQEDLNFAFNNLQLENVTLLSEQEMKETRGEAIWFYPVIAAGARFALTGFIRHGLNQAISRNGVGVSNKAIMDTMRNPTKIKNQSNGRVRFEGNQGGVVLNKNGEVITTWGKPR